MPHPFVARARLAGFTLLELVTAAAIIGIIATVAIPIYDRYRLRAIRTEGLEKASQVQAAESTFFAQYGVYATCLGAMGVTWPGGYYGITSAASITTDNNYNAMARAKGAYCPDSVQGSLVSGMDYFPMTKFASGCQMYANGAVGILNGQYFLEVGLVEIWIVGWPRGRCIGNINADMTAASEYYLVIPKCTGFCSQQTSVGGPYVWKPGGGWGYEY